MPKGKDPSISDPCQHLKAIDSAAICSCIPVTVSQVTGRCMIGVLHMCVNHDLNRCDDYCLDGARTYRKLDEGAPGGGGGGGGRCRA